MTKEEFEKLIMVESGNIVESLNNHKEDLFALIPELRYEDGFLQNNNWHIYDVWNHTLIAMQNSEPILKKRIALLLHDIGKPFSFQDEDNGVRHFRGHAIKSSEIAFEILKRLKYSEEEIEEICFLIKNHSTFIKVEDVDLSNAQKFKDLLYIQYCDSKAYNPIYVQKAVANLDIIKKEILEKELELTRIKF